MSILKFDGNYGCSFSYNVSEMTEKKQTISHCHNEYEILFILNGSGRYIVEGREYPIRPRTLMLISPLAYHAVELDKGITYERYVISFSVHNLIDRVRKILSTFFSEENECSVYFSSESINSFIGQHIDRFENMLNLPEEKRDVYFDLLISELVVLLCTSKKEVISYNEDEIGIRVIKYLNDHIDKNISLDYLAKKFFVSKYYLCRAFKKHNGISVHGYINQKRVIYAKQLIEQGETASGAAYKVGFGDYSAFYRAYVKVTGKSPTNN